MALRLTLKANERVIAGGAVLRNDTGRSVHLVVENQVPLLRDKDILFHRQADTACKRIYLAIQLMYIDRDNLQKYQRMYWDLTDEVIHAAPSTTSMFKAISQAIYNGKYYQALKETKKLIQYEEALIRNATGSGRGVPKHAEGRAERPRG